MENKISKEKKNKKQQTKKYRVDFLRLLLVACFIYFAFTFVKQQLSINEYNVKIDYMEQKIANQKEEKQELEEQEKLAKDAQYIETLAREKLGLVKPYEKVFIDGNK